jgi:uncharacterized protein
MAIKVKPKATKKESAKSKPMTEAEMAEVNQRNAEKADVFERVARKEDKGDITIEQKLRALFSLQNIDSKIDRIRIIRGELPLEVQDLEDELAGLQTRLDKLNDEVNDLKTSITEKTGLINTSKTLIKKFEEQQNSVRNNREFEAINKEVEFQHLESQLAEKRIKEAKITIDAKSELVKKVMEQLEEKQLELKHKQGELSDIVDETEKEERELIAESQENEKIIEERLLVAYKRIRKNARNGLAVVAVDRDACGGCFNKIPPQRQLDIRMCRKIIVCEYCGRILVDERIAQSV